MNIACGMERLAAQPAEVRFDPRVIAVCREQCTRLVEKGKRRGRVDSTRMMARNCEVGIGIVGVDLNRAQILAHRTVGAAVDVSIETGECKLYRRSSSRVAFLRNFCEAQRQRGRRLRNRARDPVGACARQREQRYQEQGRSG